jgi:hypothetical protein
MSNFQQVNTVFLLAGIPKLWLVRNDFNIITESFSNHSKLAEISLCFRGFCRRFSKRIGLGPWMWWVVRRISQNPVDKFDFCSAHFMIIGVCFSSDLICFTIFLVNKDLPNQFWTGLIVFLLTARILSWRFGIDLAFVQEEVTSLVSESNPQIEKRVGHREVLRRHHL